MKRNVLVVFISAIVLVTGSFVSCKKDVETIATVIVKNESGDVIPGATVRLFGSGSAQEDNPGEIRFDTTGITNGTGKVSFNFSEFYKQGQAGFVVLDIIAEKGLLAGEGIIKVEEESTTEESIVIN